MAPAVLVLSLLVRSDREAKVRALSRLESKLWRTTLLVVSVLTMILIATALYVYSTTLRQSSIISIQSRYFLPLLPLLLLAFYGNTLKNQRKPKIALVCMSAFVLVGAALALYDRLYAVVPLILG